MPPPAASAVPAELPVFEELTDAPTDPIASTDTTMPPDVEAYFAWCEAYGMSNDAFNKQSRRNVAYAPFKRPLTLNSIGAIRRFKIIQVIDKNNVIADAEVTPPAYAAGASGTPVTIQEQHMQVVWLTGITTDDLYDDSWVRYDFLWKAASTHQYSTVRGSAKTLLELQPFDIRPYKGHFSDAKERRVAKPK